MLPPRGGITARVSRLMSFFDESEDADADVNVDFALALAPTSFSPFPSADADADADDPAAPPRILIHSATSLSNVCFLFTVGTNVLWRILDSEDSSTTLLLDGVEEAAVEVVAKGEEDDGDGIAMTIMISRARTRMRPAEKRLHWVVCFILVGGGD